MHTITHCLRVICRSFRWKFNNSGENLDIDRDRHHKNGSMMDVLRYTPVTDQDYGTLSCWAANDVGQQQSPCVFQVVLAGERTVITWVISWPNSSISAQYWVEIKANHFERERI